MQVVKTDKGYIAGTVIGEVGNEVSIFRGIPYAAPPVGALRWKPPQPATAWRGIRECTHYSAISPQAFMPGMPSSLPLSEDCLYLNVVTPARKPDAGLPVMVWMHGGGYSMGSGNDEVWNNYRLPRCGVVVVTLTHRLGPIGLVAHPALSQESPCGVSGNYLFLDLIASLKWIQNNIAEFGGDPGNITIFGESGGGAKVSVMMSTPFAKGLFHKAICQSGTATAILGQKPLKDIEADGVKLFEKLGVNTLEEARKIPGEKILQASQTMELPPAPGRALPIPIWDGAVDGWMLPQSTAEAFRTGAINAVPLITLACLGELTGPGPLVMPQIVPAYIEMIEALNRQKVHGFACIFDQVPGNWRKEGAVSAHSTELTYVFGDWDDSTGWWKNSTGIMLQSGAKSAVPFLTLADKFIADAMMHLWAQFAKNGKPAVKGLTDWPEYESKHDRYLYINEKLEIKTGFSKIAQPQ